MSITIYLKNLAGDITSLEVDPTWTASHLLENLRLQDEEAYPPGRTRLLRSPGPFEEGEVISIWIEDSVYMKRVIEKGKEHIRFVIPIKEVDDQKEGVELHVECGLMWPRYDTAWMIRRVVGQMKEKFIGAHWVLYDALCQSGYTPSPSIMRTLYQLIDAHLTTRTEEHRGKIYTYQFIYSEEEPVECDCGEIVLRGELAEHQRRHLKIEEAMV